MSERPAGLWYRVFGSRDAVPEPAGVAACLAGLGAPVRFSGGDAGWTGRAQGFAGDLREKLSMNNLAAATLDAYDGIDGLVNANRVLVASDPLVAEADGMEATLAQNPGLAALGVYPPKGTIVNVTTPAPAPAAQRQTVRKVIRLYD